MPLRITLFFYLLVLFLTFSEDLCMGAGTLDLFILKHSQPVLTFLQAFSNNQTLVMRWKLNHSRLLEACDDYEVQIGLTENLAVLHNYNVCVHAEGGVYTWTWTSALPLECADHSVRIRRLYNQSVPSAWSQWETNKGAQEIVDRKKKTEMFPFQRVLREGASAMLCCMPPKGVEITDMTFDGQTYPLISIGDRVKAIAVNKLTIPTRLIRSVTFKCSDTKGSKHCLNYVSFPPKKPHNLSCATEDFSRVTCKWDPVRKSNLLGTYRPTHIITIENSDRAPISCLESRCSFPVVPGLEEYRISLVVRNQLGEAAESTRFNIFERVFPVLKWGQLNPGVTDANVSWIIQGNLSSVDLLCQVMTNTCATIVVECRGGTDCKVRLEQLLPNTRYSTRVCCAGKGSLCGDWVSPRVFSTYPLVHLDIWRTVKQRYDPFGLRKVTLLWTPHVPGSASGAVIQNYVIQWSQGGRRGTAWAAGGQNQLELSIGPQRRDFTVHAVLKTALKDGVSNPAHITVPPEEQVEQRLVERRVSGDTDRGFPLSWAGQDSATCGYTVEWCSLRNQVPCNVRWVNVPKENSSLLLPPGRFEVGCRYTFNIYECRGDGHRLLEIQTGYTQELKSLLSPRVVHPVNTTSSSVTLGWLYNEDDQALPGFVTGYQMTLQEAGRIPYTLNVSVSDPRRKSVTIKGLQEDRKYTLYLSAVTNGGRGASTLITFQTTRNYSVYLAKVLTPLLVLLVCTILLWLQRSKLHSGFKGMLAYPAGMNIKPFEIDSFLHEASVKMGFQTVEECVSCNIEVLGSMHPEGTGVTEPFCGSDQAYSPQTADVLRRKLYYNTVSNTIVRQPKDSAAASLPMLNDSYISL